MAAARLVLLDEDKEDSGDNNDNDGDNNDNHFGMEYNATFVEIGRNALEHQPGQHHHLGQQ